MKKLNSIFLALLLSISLSSCSSSQPKRLSDLTDDELWEFVESCQIENQALELYGMKNAAMEPVRFWVAEFEENPDLIPAISEVLQYNFACALKDAVNDYYGISEEGS